MRTIITSFLFIVMGSSAMAQQPWTLQACIDHARQSNITIKRQKINAEYAKNTYSESRFAKLPSLNASVDYSVGFGRYLNTVNYEYVDQTTQQLSGGVSTGATLFQGFVKQNTQKQEQQNMLAAIQQVAETENDISLLIASYYLQILFDKELLIVAKAQRDVTQEQVDRTQKLVDAGSAAMGTLLEIKSQLAKENLNVTTQENALGISLLNLSQLLDLESVSGFDVVVPQLPEVPLLMSDNATNIYQTAVGTMPQIKRGELELEASKYQLKKAQGYLYPSLSIGAGWNTQASKIKGLYDWDFSNSLKNNANSYIGLNLSIPIFNGFQTRIGIKNSKLAVLDAEYALQSEKLALRKEIEQARADAMASQKKYAASQDAVASYQESFTYTQKRFEVGMVNSVDYSTAKNEYTRAQSELLQSKYEYILRSKILDFYKGIPLTL
ncbi:MAG: TolC family protein [Breznakibacter sp.]